MVDSSRMQTTVKLDTECTRRESFRGAVGLELLPVGGGIADSAPHRNLFQFTPPFHIVSSIGVESVE